MPEIERSQPAHLQIANHFKKQIMIGELPPRSKLPSINAIGAEWNVSHGIAQRAVDYLKTEGLVYTEQGKGTFVDGHRVKYGPQQRISAPAFPMSERVVMTAAELTEAPGDIVTILGLQPSGGEHMARVIRREWVTYEDGDVPFMLSVAWCAPEAATIVPELLDRLALDSGVAAKLIAERTSRINLLRGRSARESRPVKDDGREGPLLRLPKTARVYAEVYTWTCGQDVLEYGEFILLERRVIESDMEL